MSPYKRTLLAEDAAMAPDADCYDMDIEPDDIEMSDTVTVVWETEVCPFTIMLGKQRTKTEKKRSQLRLTQMY